MPNKLRKIQRVKHHVHRSDKQHEVQGQISEQIKSGLPGKWFLH